VDATACPRRASEGVQREGEQGDDLVRADALVSARLRGIRADVGAYPCGREPFYPR
jgi:hypothetical protein